MRTSRSVLREARGAIPRAYSPKPQELRPNSTLIFDNAPFHKKQDLEAIAHQHGHHHLFLPPYSPDFNRIEPDFANLKKIRQSAPPNTPLFDIVKSYGN